MAYPAGFVYQDVNLQFTRLSSPESAFISVVGGLPPIVDTWTIGDAYDFSASVDAAPLSNGRVITVYYAERVHEALHSTGAGPINGDDVIEAVITSGITEVGRVTLEFPPSPLAIDPENAFSWGTTGLNFGFQIATAGDYAVFGAAIFDLAPSGSDPKWYTAAWLVLLDCSGDTPVVVDEYLRDSTASPSESIPPVGDVQIALSQLDDSRVLVSMHSPDAPNNPGDEPVGAIFPIHVSGGSLNFQDNGYPDITGTYDFSYEPRLGYYGDVGLWVANNAPEEIAFGLHVNAAGDSLTLGTETHSWSHDGATYYPWGSAGRNPSSPSEPGVFYAPVYRIPIEYTDVNPANPVYTAKLQYTGSGDVEMLDVSPALPSKEFDARIVWGSATWAYWGCVENNGKVMTAVCASHVDRTWTEDPFFLFHEDLWLVDDTFGECNVYRVANVSGANWTDADGTANSGTDFECGLIASGSLVYGAMNVVDMFDSEGLLSGEESASAVVIALINLNQPDIDGGLIEQRRKFWRNRPGW